MNDVARFCGDAGKDAIGRGLDFHDGLIGLDLEEHLAFSNLLTLLFQPRDELARFLRHLERRHHDADSHQLPAPTFSGVASARAAAAIISTTCGLGGASVSRTIGSVPPTVTNGAPATSSSSAGNRVITSWPVFVTTISSSMRAALHPSVDGQNVSSANTIPGLISCGCASET